jgi:hypothetical protein
MSGVMDPYFDRPVKTWWHNKARLQPCLFFGNLMQIARVSARVILLSLVYPFCTRSSLPFDNKAIQGILRFVTWPPIGLCWVLSAFLPLVLLIICPWFVVLLISEWGIDQWLPVLGVPAASLRCAL